MKAVSKILAGAAATAALAGVFAAPAAAQYYPNSGYGNGGLGNVIVGSILNDILRGGNPYGYNNYYGVNNYNLERAAVDQCARATEQRLNGGYGGYNNGYGGYNNGYGGYNNGYGYGYNNAGYRVVQIERVERTRNGNMRVYGTAANGAYQGNYGYNRYGGYNQPYGGYANAPTQQYRFNCKFERSGRITDLDINRGRYAYGY